MLNFLPYGLGWASFREDTKNFATKTLAAELARLAQFCNRAISVFCYSNIRVKGHEKIANLVYYMACYALVLYWWGSLDRDAVSHRGINVACTRQRPFGHLRDCRVRATAAVNRLRNVTGMFH